MTTHAGSREPAPGLLVAQSLRTAAGSPAPVEVTVTNAAAEPRVLAVGAIGLDAAWLPPIQRTEVLEPGQSTTVTVTLSPVMGTVPAQYPLAFTAQALDPPTLRPSGAPPAMVDSVLLVNPRNQLSLELTPRAASAISSRRIALTLRNGGDQPARVHLTVKASPRLRVRLRERDVEVAPGAVHRVRGRVTVPRARLVGSVSHHTYTVTARGTEAHRHVDGSIGQRPLIAVAMLKVCAVLMVLSVWIAAAIVFVPQLAERIGSGQSDTTSATVQDGTGSGAGGTGGGAGAAGGTGSEGGASGSAGGSGGSGGTGSGQGGAQPTAATDADSVALSGTVAGARPGGVKVSLQPTSLVDETAQGGVGVGVPAAELGSTGMSLASAFLNRAVRGAPPDRTAATTSDGSWAFVGVRKPGYYLLTFSKPGYQSQSFVVDSSSAAAAEPLEVDLVAGEGRLAGLVTGPGGPVGAATVTITDGTNTITTSTNSRGQVGRWSVSGLSTPGTYVVQASRPGLSSESRMVELGAGGSVTADLELRHGVGSLVGRVRAVDESGRWTGIGGAQVTITGDDGVVRTVTTLTQGEPASRGDARATGAFVGSYTLPGLGVPGTYVVTYSGPGLQTQTSTVRFGRGQPRATVDADLVSASGSVAGTITGRSTSGAVSPVVGAGLTLSNAENTYKTMSTSDPAGSYLFDGVAPGTYSLAAEFFGFVTDHVTVTVRAGRTAQLDRQIGAVEGGVLAARSALQGRAIDGGTSLPVTCPATEADCLVATVLEPGVDDDTSDDHTYRTRFLPADEFRLPDRTTDPDGGLLPGVHTVTVSAPHYSAASARVRVAGDQTIDIGTLSLLPAPRIVGSVTAAAGAPSGSTCIWAVPGGDSAPPVGCDTTPTGAAHQCVATSATFEVGDDGPVCAYVSGTGSYSIEAPSSGTYTIYVMPSDPEYVTPSAAGILLEAGVTRNQSYVLNRLGRVLLTVRKPGPSGALIPSSGTVVALSPDAGTPSGSAARTNAAGALTIKQVPAGAYQATATEGGLTGSSTFSVGLNQDVAVRLTMTNPIDAVIGQVTSSVDGARTKVAGASVSVTAPVGYGADDSVDLGTVGMTTDGNGCLVIEHTGSDSPAIPATGDCSWPATTSPDPSRGKKTFLSTAASSVQVSAPGYAPVTRTNLTLDTAAVNGFTLTPLPVPLGTVPLLADPADPGFDWSQVAFSVEPTAGATTSISIGGSGTGTGSLVWNDSRVGVPGSVTPGTYRVTATRAGYLPGTALLDCEVGASGCGWRDDATHDPLRLVRLASLSVVAKDGAATVEGVRYTLRRGGTAVQTLVGSPGGVTFDGLDPSATDYAVDVHAAGYRFGDAGHPLAVSCGADSSIVLGAGATTSCQIAMERLGTITGTVTGIPAPPPSTDSSTTIAGATVRVVACTRVVSGACTATDDAVSFTGTTGADGRFSITGTADSEGLATATDWLVTATAAGFSLPAVTSPAERGVLVTDFTDGAASADVTMNLDPVDFSALLIDGNGDAFTGATVELLTVGTGGTTVVATATADGTRYRFTDVVPGVYVVRASGNGLLVQTQSVTVQTDGQLVTMSVVRAANVASGTVTSSASSGGLKDATVWLCASATCTSPSTGTDKADLSRSTDTSGGFLFRNVPDGSYYVRVAKYGYVTQVLGPYDFDHLLGAVPPVTAQLVPVTRNVAITVKPTWSNDDLSAAGVTVTLTPAGGAALAPVPVTTQTDTHGTVSYVASFNQLAWGCWTVTVNLPAGHYGKVGALQNKPDDSRVPSCAAGDQIKVSGDDTITADATAVASLDEGRVDVSVLKTGVAGFDQADDPSQATLTMTGAGAHPGPTAYGVGATATSVWLPAGSYTVHAAPQPADTFWSDGEVSITVPATKPGPGLVTAKPTLVEQSATLVVTLTGVAAGEKAVLTLTGDVAVPNASPNKYDAPITLSPGGTSKTYHLPRGSWTVTAQLGSRTDSGTVTVTNPAPSGGGSYTLALDLTAPVTP